MMRLTGKTLSLTALAVAAVGVGTAVVLGGTQRQIEGTIPAGTTIVATLDRELSTANATVGDAVMLTTTEPLQLDEGAAIPPGIIVYGEVAEAHSGGRIAGAPELALRFNALELDGHTYDLRADPFRVRGKSDAGQSAAQIGGGAVAGGVLGAVIGDDAGDAVTGALVGAAIGTGVAVATKGDELVLASGQALRIKLRQALTVRYTPAGEASAP